MKKLITIFILLLTLSACTTQKQKIKEKAKTEHYEKEVSSSTADVQQNLTVKSQKTDSTAVKTDFSAIKTFGSIAQNLSLTNNGKCTDGGQIRFLKFTDAQGNMTEVPVNDNTDLNFNTAAELTTENKQLKSELASKTTENTDLEAKLKAATAKNHEYEQSAKASVANTDTRTERSQLTTFLWCIGLTIVFWEAGKFYVKKQFKP